MKNTRIILADDQLLIRAGVRAIIEALPSHELVSECVDGHQVIAATHQFHPDIILLDIAMPGPSGIEVARSVRQFDTHARRGGSANPDIELSEISASMGDGNRLPRSRSNEKTPP